MYVHVQRVEQEAVLNVDSFYPQWKAEGYRIGVVRPAVYPSVRINGYLGSYGDNR